MNNHLGIELSRRDDLISFCYLLIFFLKGTLPWDTLATTNNDLDNIHIHEEIKYNLLPDLLCKGLPEQLYFTLTYCLSLRFTDQPDYHFIRGSLADILQQRRIKIDTAFIWIRFDHIDS